MLAPFYNVTVEYVPGKQGQETEGLQLMDYIKMNECPVDLKYMVYFIRRFLKVELKNDKREIDYVSFITYDKVVFTDATKVAGRTWKELKHEAMGVHEAQKQKYLSKFTAVDKLLVKNLIAAQKA